MLTDWASWSFQSNLKEFHIQCRRTFSFWLNNFTAQSILKIETNAALKANLFKLHGEGLVTMWMASVKLIFVFWFLVFGFWFLFFRRKNLRRLLWQQHGGGDRATMPAGVYGDQQSGSVQKHSHCHGRRGDGLRYGKQSDGHQSQLQRPVHLGGLCGAVRLL